MMCTNSKNLDCQDGQATREGAILVWSTLTKLTERESSLHHAAVGVQALGGNVSKSQTLKEAAFALMCHPGATERGKVPIIYGIWRIFPCQDTQINNDK